MLVAIIERREWCWCVEGSTSTVLPYMAGPRAGVASLEDTLQLERKGDILRVGGWTVDGE